MCSPYIAPTLQHEQWSPCPYSHYGQPYLAQWTVWTTLPCICIHCDLTLHLGQRDSSPYLSPADGGEDGPVVLRVVDALVEAVHGRVELVLVTRLHEHRLVLLNPVPNVVFLQQQQRYKS